MNRRFFLPLMVIGFFSSMLFGCENNGIEVVENNYPEVVEENPVEISIETQEIKKPVQYGRVTKKCIMRSEPSRMAAKLSFLSINDTVEILYDTVGFLSKNDTITYECCWSLVKYRDETGYVRTSELEFLPQANISETEKDTTRIGLSENFEVSDESPLQIVNPKEEKSNSFSFYLLLGSTLIIITIFILFIHWRKMIKSRTNKDEISSEIEENMIDESYSKSVQMKKEKSSHTTNKTELSLDVKKASMKDGFNSLSNQVWGVFKTVESTLNEMVVELQKRANDLEEELYCTTQKLNEVKVMLKRSNEERKAIKANEKEWRMKCDTLVSQNKELEQQIDQYKQDLMQMKCDLASLKNRLNSTEKKLQDGINDRKKVMDELRQNIAERDHLINRLQIEAKFYTKKVVFLPSTQNFAQRAMAFFDTLDQLLGNNNRLKMNVPSDANADDYNYYLIRIERKFYASMAKLENLSQWRFELQLLAQQEIVPASGLIDKKMGGGKVKDNEWESMLRMLFYQDIMSTLAGATVVMSDELALMLPHMVSGVSGTDGFAQITEKLRKAIADMGYELNYVKPFTRLDGYKNVQNVKYTEANVPQGTIFEVLKMALNYESYMTNTEVSAK